VHKPFPLSQLSIFWPTHFADQSLTQNAVIFPNFGQESGSIH